MIKIVHREGGLDISLRSLEDTEELGRTIADVLEPSMTLLLHGGLGAGKTTLVRALCRRLGWKRTCSPSFALVNEYAGARIPVAHADLYRLENVDGRDFGFDDYLDDGWILIIEWPERLYRNNSFPEVWRCDIKCGIMNTEQCDEQSEERRVMSISPEGLKAKAMLERLVKRLEAKDCE